MANLPPGSTGIEYTPGTGPSFPGAASSIATTSTSTPVVGVGTAFPAGPATGQLYYRTDLSHLYCFTGSGWSQS